MGKKAEILKKIQLFGTLGEEELLKLSGISEEVLLKKGAVIIEEGKPLYSLYIVEKGCIRVKTAAGIEILLGEGSPIGELSFIDKGLPSASAQADEETIVIRINSEAFEELLEKDSVFAYKLYRSIAENLCQKLRDTNEWLTTRQWLSEIEKEAGFLPKI
jgi:CRP-like cAMP-binding protein